MVSQINYPDMTHIFIILVNNKSNHGMWKIPHEDFWGRCRTCTCCSRYKSDDNGFNAVFGGDQAKFGDVNQHPDEKRRSSGYGTNF